MAQSKSLARHHYDWSVPLVCVAVLNAIQLADTIGAFGACAARTDDE
jgi:hypothetical protein